MTRTGTHRSPAIFPLHASLLRRLLHMLNDGTVRHEFGNQGNRESQGLLEILFDIQKKANEEDMEHHLHVLKLTHDIFWIFGPIMYPVYFMADFYYQLAVDLSHTECYPFTPHQSALRALGSALSESRWYRSEMALQLSQWP